MALEYVNRRGERYYAQQGLTKTGKPKYFCSKKPGDNPLAMMPAGFEFRESPVNAVVSLRKVQASPILPAERELLEGLLARLSKTSCLVDVDGNSLVVYTSNMNEEAAARMVAMLAGPRVDQHAAQNLLRQHANFNAMFRFRLANPEERLYSADRWCFLGSIDDWFPLAHSQPLDTLARTYLPHLGEESFYELM